MSSLIGKGMIATRFSDYSLQSKYIMFAGTINDSSFNDINLMKQEEMQMKNILSENSSKIIVYFSSCSIQDNQMKNTPYVLHKVLMEELIQESNRDYYIFRLPQVIGLNDADSSLITYLVNAIYNNNEFKIWDGISKNLIDIDDVYSIIDKILEDKIYLNNTINIANKNSTTVLKIVHKIEKFIKKQGKYKLVTKGSNYNIDTNKIDTIADSLNISFSDDYLDKSLNKYYSYLIESPKSISIIVPTYNEEHGIEEFYRRTKNVLTKLSPRFNHEIIFINDFSTDSTYEKIAQLALKDSSVKVINFARNFGNQVAITAGIDYAKGDIAIIIDDDLQDPPEIIINFIAQWDKGYDVVYGVRPKRSGVNPLFKFVAKSYYRIIGNLSDTKIPNDTGDFRLIDRKVINYLKNIREENRYYRGLVAWVGFPQIGVIYERDKRYAGVSTFTLKKYINFAINGLTSFTEKPLYFSSVLGIFLTLISLFFIVSLIISKLIDPSISIQGWTSIAVMILFFGGIQLLSLGIIGIYISKIYREVKNRPLYTIKNNINMEDVKNE